MDDTALVRKFLRVFGCDAARIFRSCSCGTMFLILGWNRNTKTDREKNPGAAQWFMNGIALDFDYVEEQVVAHGKTERALIASAKRYKRLLDEQENS